MTTQQDEQAAAEALRSETVLGFDTESRPAFVSGVVHPTALVQLAGSKAVYIFHLNKLDHLESILTLFSDPGVTKAGIALADDLKKLRSTYKDFEPAGFVEIGHLSRTAGIKQTGLRSLAGMLLGFRISKREQRSNWGAETLTPSQLRYAATDAWASREIYLKLRDLPRADAGSDGHA
ncbi:MAG: 3'-5' exonuclease [bacterium]